MKDAKQAAASSALSPGKPYKAIRLGFIEEESVEPLSQVLIKAGISGNKKRAAELLDTNPMMKTRNYKVQVTLGLPNCPWKVAHAILETGADPISLG